MSKDLLLAITLRFLICKNVSLLVASDDSQLLDILVSILELYELLASVNLAIVF